VETTTSKDLTLFQLTPEKPGHGIKGNTFSKGRILVGRTESCELVIPVGSVSAVHAVLEITPNGAKVYDMNSKNGTFVNGAKVVAETIKVGDKVTFGNVSFTFEEYKEAPELPPVLDVLEPQRGEASIKKLTTGLPTKPADLPAVPEASKEEGPYIVYPLGADPNSDYSEYIFEDVEELVPIFKYDHGKQAVEIIILFNDKVFSVDYLEESNGTYHIVGANPKKRDVEFAYLGKNDKLPFVEVKAGNCVVHNLPGYKIQHLTDNEVVEPKEARINIQGEDVLRLENGHLEIYVRRVSAPPQVKSAPFFRRDSSLKKYLFLILLFTFLPLAALNFIQVDKELDKEKDPERIARILYKQPLKISKKKAVEKTKKAPPKKQKTKVVKQKTKPKKPTPKPAKKTPKKVVKKVTKAPGVKTAKKVQTVKKVKKPMPKRTPRPMKSASSAASATRSKTVRARKAVTPKKTVGAVDVFKNFSFKSTVRNNMAKGGTIRGATTSASSSTDIGSTTIGGGVATNVKKADVGTQVGSLTGATVGKLAQSKGAEGLSAKRGIYTAGIPSETVVLGSMDPDVIRRILREHIPQFRYCYQKELDRNAGKDVSGTIGLVFTIGASGHVSKAGVSQTSNLPGHVRRCVVGVLRGIKFPRPMGGGTVDVKQPFNFMPKRL
jgi:outer membrane biosynthesis protein TonB